MPSLKIARKAAGGFYEIPFFVSIVSLKHRTPEQAMAEIEEQHQKCGLKYFAVSLPCQPQGKDPMAKIMDHVQQFRALQKCRKDPELKIGILIQQTMGHGAKWNPAFDRELDWQRTVHNNGETTVRFCPTDSRFCQYISEAVALLAQEKPAFLIVDDDARLSVNADKGVCECFCPNHTALFNEKYGTSYTPEALRDAVNSAKDHDPLLWKFWDFSAGTMTDYMRLLRQSADRTAPGVPMILCGNSGNAGQKGEWAKVLAGNAHPAMLRIGSGNYLEGPPRQITQRFPGTAVQKILEPGDILLLDEADTCPHNCYSKSARTMHLHIAAGLLNGLDGAKLWITDTARFDPPITKPYAKILAKYRNFYPALHQCVREVAWQGPVVNIPRPAALPRPHLPKWWRQGMWATTYLSLFGLPVRYGDAGTSGLHLLSSDDPDCFSDAELNKMLQEAALIDSAAAKKLIARGFAGKIGLKEIQPLQYPVQGEEIEADKRFLRGSRMNDSILVPLEQTQVLTRLLLHGAEPVPGATRYQNIIVTAWRVEWDCRIDLHPDRKELLRYLLKQLPGGVPAYFDSPSDATLWYGRGREFDLAAVANYGYDPLEQIVLELPELPDAVLQLLPDGNWKDPVFSGKDGKLCLDVHLDCAEISVFKLFRAKLQ